MIHYVSVHVYYDRGEKTFIIQRVLLIPTENEDEALRMTEDWLTERFPEPAYYGHEFEAKILEDVSVVGPKMIELSLADEHLAVAQTKLEP